MVHQNFILWYDEAVNDFESAQILKIGKKYNNAVFYFVQSAEKAIKALLYYRNAAPWGHALIQLLEIYEEIVKSKIRDPDIKTIASEMERHYLSSRYPDASIHIPPKEAYTENDANELEIKAKHILDFVISETELKEDSSNEK